MDECNIYSMSVQVCDPPYEAPASLTGPWYFYQTPRGGEREERQLCA